MVQLVPYPDDEPFDLVSVTDASTLFLRAGDIALYAVLNDGQACGCAIEPTLDRITGPLNPMQARELAAELAAAKLHLENPPLFKTIMSNVDGAELEMIAKMDPAGPSFVDKDPSTVVFVKHFVFQHTLDRIEGRTRKEAVSLLKENRLSFCSTTKVTSLSMEGQVTPHPPSEVRLATHRPIGFTRAYMNRRPVLTATRRAANVRFLNGAVTLNSRTGTAAISRLTL